MLGSGLQIWHQQKSEATIYSSPFQIKLTSLHLNFRLLQSCDLALGTFLHLNCWGWAAQGKSCLLHSWDILSHKLQQQQTVPNYLYFYWVLSLSFWFLCSRSLNFFFLALVITNCTTCSSTDIDSAECHVGGLLSLTAALPHTRNSKTQVIFLHFAVVLCFNFILPVQLRCTTHSHSGCNPPN